MVCRMANPKYPQEYLRTIDTIPRGKSRLGMTGPAWLPILCSHFVTLSLDAPGRRHYNVLSAARDQPPHRPGCERVSGGGDAQYAEKVSQAADAILANLPEPHRPFSGPSGSGETTTALKIEEELERRGGPVPHHLPGQLLQDPNPKTVPPHRRWVHRL